MSWLPPCALIWAGSRRRVGIRLGSCLRMLEQLEAGGIVSLPAKRPGSRTGTGGRCRRSDRDREREPGVAAGEATGIENGNRGSETAAYESLGSGLRHRV